MKTPRLRPAPPRSSPAAAKRRLGFALAAVCMWTGSLGASCSRKAPSPSRKDAEPIRITSSPPEQTAATAAPAAEPVLPPLPEGLQYVDGPGVISRVKQTKAKGVVVNVWASWCGPCKAEVPLFLELQKKYSDLQFLFVSVDAPDKADPAAAFVKEHSLPAPGLLAKPPLGDFKETLTPRWQGSLPASFLFDPTGKLRYWWGAQVFEHEITPILEGFLAGKHIDGEARFQIRAGGNQ